MRPPPLNIIVAGIIGRHPYGGVAWCSLMYLLGLRSLGHRVWYLEDTGECNFDPVAQTLATEPSYAIDFIRQTVTPHGLANAWCYVDYRGEYHGQTRERWQATCRDADAFLNLSGGTWFHRDEYMAIPRRAFIDSDPAFTQLALAKGDSWYVDFFKGFDALFTFGSNIGTPACPVPVGDFVWRPTWQPVCLDLWPVRPATSDAFTTVMSWQIESFTDIGGNKDAEFAKVLDLPCRSPVPLELAIAGKAPLGELIARGWRCRDAFEISRDVGRYRRYLGGSRGEFSVAKRTYVATNSGWFSDRTECYLAAGKPAVVQETGFSAHLPTGRGLYAWRTADEAAAALAEVAGNYAYHCREARALAAAHFSPAATLVPLLEQLGASDVRAATSSAT